MEDRWLELGKTGMTLPRAEKDLTLVYICMYCVILKHVANAWSKRATSIGINQVIPSLSIAPIQQGMRCTWPEIQTIEYRRGRKVVSEKDKKIRNFSSHWNQSIDISGQLSVLANCPANTSSWGKPQTKQHLSKVMQGQAESFPSNTKQFKYMKNLNFYQVPQISHSYFIQQTLSLVTC